MRDKTSTIPTSPLTIPPYHCSVRGVDKKMRLAECVVAREKDLGVNDSQYTVITSLGHILKEGDMVFGYVPHCLVHKYSM